MGKPFWSNQFFVLPVLLYFVFGLILRCNIEHGDEILWFNQFRQEPLNRFFYLMTLLGDGRWQTIVVLVLFFINKQMAISLAMMGLSALPITFTLKDQIAADRPKSYFEKQGNWERVRSVPLVDLPVGQTSFPSGHTATAFSMYALMCSFLPKKWEQWGAALAILSIVVAISRIFLVCHFLSDVLGGAALGLMFAAGGHFLFRSLNFKQVDAV